MTASRSWPVAWVTASPSILCMVSSARSSIIRVRYSPKRYCRPEIQGLDSFVDGINNIVEAQQRVALHYLEDGSIEDACPPLQALLLMMATGKYDGMDAQHPNFRAMFTRENLLDSDWYRERLEVKQHRDIALWTRHVASLRSFLEDGKYADEAARLGIARRLQSAEQTLAQVSQPGYLASLVGTLGADPLGPAGKAVRRMC